MSTLTPHQLKALDYNNHISLTANAGSGKTFVLSHRYLEIALNENISLRNIAAITFTDKAASELYKKIASQVENRISKSIDDREIKKLENIRRQLVSANISTIHSFCIDILREFPVEAGLDAGFTPIDERLSSELIELTVEELIKDSLNNPAESDDLKYLIRIFASKNLFARELISLVKNRKNVIELEKKLYNKSVEKIADYFHDQLGEMFNKLFLHKKDLIISHLKIINEAVIAEDYGNEKALIVQRLISKLIEEKDTTSQIKLMLEIKSTICSTNGKIYTIKYLKNSARNSVEPSCEFIETYFADFPAFEIDDHKQIELELAVFGKKMIGFFVKAVERYTERKKENGYLDYEDILLFTGKILDDENVRSALHKKYKYIMIDEYQDTNEIQYRIFLPILDYLRKGNLFVVGDEKQSIYMFRDAELEIFNRTKQNISDQSGEKNLLNLPDSFRMAPELCLFTNYIFKNLFGNPNPYFNEVEHSDLVTARENSPVGKVEILFAGKDEQSTDAEAKLIASRIQKLMTENPGYKWSDVAVLCRKRKSFTELEKVFIQNNIPFIILGGKGFYQRQIIYDIYNYFSFLTDKQNNTALVGILRSPFFSISDAEIFEISRRPEKLYWDKLKAYAKEKSIYNSFIEKIEDNIFSAGTLDMASLLRKILHDSDYLAVVASKPNGQQELANISKLVSLTIKFHAQGFHTLYDYVNFLKESISTAEDESQAGLADESDSVRIMTLHQSKGMEYPAVFLYKCSESSKSSRAASKRIQVSKQFGLLTKVPVNQDYFGKYKAAPIVELSNYIVHKKNLAEVKRLFYVGVTRAKDCLFLSAPFKEKLSYPSDSFISLLQEGLRNDLSGEAVEINSELTYLKKTENGYQNLTEQKDLIIPVKTEIEFTSAPVQQDDSIYMKKKLLLEEIEDIPEGEIISATKVAVYKQCPLKYKLTYELGFLPLINNYKKWLNESSGRFDFNSEETEQDKFEDSDSEKTIRSIADVKGRIIHRILQREIPEENLCDLISAEVKNEIGIQEYNQPGISEFELGIYNDALKFYKSDSYTFLKKFDNYKNEFEIYVKENDYYLYGIIDKLIITGSKVIIVDYKTDDIKNEEIEERSKAYLTQLKFYSYIVNRFLPGINQFELRLIFIKHPDDPVILNAASEDISLNNKEIEMMVKNIRQNNYVKNTEHCARCSYSVRFKSCIVL